MPVVKVIELLGTSTESFDDALKQAVERACKTIRGVRGLDVVSQNVVVKDGKITEYRVNVKVAFGLE